MPLSTRGTGNPGDGDGCRNEPGDHGVAAGAVRPAGSDGRADVRFDGPPAKKGSFSG